MNQHPTSAAPDLLSLTLPTDLPRADRERIAARMNAFMAALVEDARRARHAVTVTR